jgi:beta-lactamase superfamily II metal-dependent hydrolase
MRVVIHNVGHGSCVSFLHDNGNSMVWDCGHIEENRPSVFLPYWGIHRISRFFITNFDQDHISDFPNLLAKIPIEVVHTNTYVGSALLEAIKKESGPITAQMRSVINYLGDLEAAGAKPPLVPPDFPGVEFTVYCHPYSPNHSTTNDLSLVTIANCNGVKFVVAGDMSEKGWGDLLLRRDFVLAISDCALFIASHHGRKDGYSEEIMRLVNPDVVVISDSNIKHATQEMTNIYARHASGINYGGRVRSVLSTRNDGDIHLDIV